MEGLALALEALRSYPWPVQAWALAHLLSLLYAAMESRGKGSLPQKAWAMVPTLFFGPLGLCASIVKIRSLQGGAERRLAVGYALDEKTVEEWIRESSSLDLNWRPASPPLQISIPDSIAEEAGERASRRGMGLLSSLRRHWMAVAVVVLLSAAGISLGLVLAALLG